MLQNYIKIAFRNLRRRRFYTVVTLLGLTVGMTFLLLIGNYIQGELAVNKSLRHADNQYLLQSRWNAKEAGYEIASLAPFGPTLKQVYPDLVADYYRHYDVGAIVSANQNHFREFVQVGDSTLLSMFGFPLLYGDPKTALQEPNSVVLTAEAAMRFFGRLAVVNQSLTIQTPRGGTQRFTITGILQAIPENSVTHQPGFAENLFVPMRNVGYFMEPSQMQSWDNRTIITHLELKPNVIASQLDKIFAHVLAINASKTIQANLTPYLSPLKTHYLKADNGLVEKMIVTLSVVGAFILLMAVVNFVNITIGMSATRTREIGVRKALGGLKKQLIGQFLAESFLLISGATVLALGLHEVVRPMFASLLERPIPSFVGWSPVSWLSLVGLVIVIGLLAGGYPAFILSNIPAVESLKGKLSASVKNGTGLRRMLITFQFVVAIFVFVGAIVVGRQVTYFFAKNLGYQKAQLLTVASVPRDWSSAGVHRMETIRNQLARVPGVRGASFSFEIPDGASSGSASLFAQGKDSTTAIIASSITADDQFAQTYGLTMRAGHFFTNIEGSTDSTSIVLTEKASKALGWSKPEQAINQYVRLYGSSFRIQGILADFHFGSLREPIKPLVFVPMRTGQIYRYFSFNLSPNDLPKTVEALQQAWTRLLPDAPFEYKFMDDTLQKLYKTEIQLQKAADVATILALIIVLLGVLGLVSLNVTQRTKEIGIRRVLGSSTIGIINLFLKEFVVMVVIATLIAWPIGYYFLSEWLTRFAYQINFSWMSFAWVALTLALLTGLVVSSQAVRAALINPATSLRSD